MFDPEGLPPPRHVRARLLHRAIRATIVVLSATLLPALFVARWIDRGQSATVQVGTLLLWFVAWLAFAIGLFFFKCPQCRRYFHRGNGVLSAFTTRCIHCGISLRPANERR
jgi:hypothetical protein